MELYPLRALVVGLGESGYWAAQALIQRGVETAVVDSRPRDVLESWRVSDLELAGGKCLLGMNLEEFADQTDALSQFDLLVVSPGVSWNHKLLAAARNLEVPVYGELEWALLQLPQRKVVVTGSNGKTTTATLIAHLLSSQGQKVFLVGNCGVAVSSLLCKTSVPDQAILVVEASSYQLEASESFVPDFGVLLNISENHLERHGSLESYIDAKFKAFQRMTSGVLVYGKDLIKFERCSSCLAQLDCRLESFGDATLKREACELEGHGITFPFERSNLLGGHNRLNVEAALKLVGEVCSSIDGNTLFAALESFEGLQHRIEVFLSTVDCVWVNDSKSTTPSSTLSALQTIVNKWPHSGIVLAIGGVKKQASWDEVWSFAVKNKSRISKILCFGQDGAELLSLAQDKGLPALGVSKVDSVVKCFVENASNGDAREHNVVLFSPGCASFDEFGNFEERGDYFKSLVGEAFFG